MTTRRRIWRFTIPLYEFDCFLVRSDADYFLRTMQKWDPAYTEAPHGNGQAVMVDTGPSSAPVFLLWVSDRWRDKSAHWLSVLSHESSHVAFHVLRTIGVRVNQHGDAEEAFCYLQQAVFQACAQRFGLRL